MVMKEHVTQCNSVAHFNSFYGSEEEDISGCETHTILVRRYIHCWFGSAHKIC